MPGLRDLKSCIRFNHRISNQIIYLLIVEGNTLLAIDFLIMGYSLESSKLAQQKGLL